MMINMWIMKMRMMMMSRPVYMHGKKTGTTRKKTANRMFNKFARCSKFQPPVFLPQLLTIYPCPHKYLVKFDLIIISVLILKNQIYI